jgi:hypothetical protein
MCPQQCKGFDIEQCDCAGYLVSQFYMDCSGGQHIAANAGPLNTAILENNRFREAER